MTKKELANALHAKGYNCAQCVACSFADELGVDIETLFKLTEGLGFGMGSGAGVCGALSAAIMAAGMRSSTGNIEVPNSKAKTYKIGAEFTEKFKAKAGSIICREIKGSGTGKPLLSCTDCIELGIDILGKYLSEN